MINTSFVKADVFRRFIIISAISNTMHQALLDAALACDLWYTSARRQVTPRHGLGVTPIAEQVGSMDTPPRHKQTFHFTLNLEFDVISFPFRSEGLLLVKISHATRTISYAAWGKTLTLTSLHSPWQNFTILCSRYEERFHHEADRIYASICRWYWCVRINTGAIVIVGYSLRSTHCLYLQRWRLSHYLLIINAWLRRTI